MADGHYKTFAVEHIDAAGARIPLIGETVDVQNITTASSLGTLDTDSHGFIQADLFSGVTVGDEVEFSVSGYPNTYRLVLTATEDEAYTTLSEASFIVENLFGGATDSQTAELYVQDLDDPTAKVVRLGEGSIGENRFHYTSNATKNLRVFAVAKADDGKLASTNFTDSPNADLFVPGNSQRSIFDHFDLATTAGTGVETLYSGDVPGNTLQTDGDKLRLYYAGQFPTANAKEITFFGFGSDLLNTTTSATGHWSCDIEIIRNSSTSLRYSATMLAAGSIIGKFTAELTTLDLTADTSIDVTADDTASGDTETHFGYCVFIPAAPAAAPPPFAPDDITGLVRWYRPEGLAAFADNDPIGTWPDDSTANVDATQSSTARPIRKDAILNGQPIVRFDGSNDYFNIGDLSALTEGEAFLVIKLDTDPPSDPQSGLWNLGDAGTSDCHFPYIDGVIYDSFGTTARKTTVNPTPSLSAAFHIYSVYSASADWANSLDGISLFSTGTNTVSFSAVATLGTSLSIGRFLDGDIAEFILYDHKLSTGDRADVMTYLQDKFGL
jgi:hypothetical protein